MNRRTSLAIVTGFAGAAALRPVAALARNHGGGGGSEIGVPVTGAVLDSLGILVGQLAGTLTISAFSVAGSLIAAVGTLTARLTDLAGNLIGTVSKVAVTLTGNITQSTCEILRLDLAGLELNLLGLEVDLSRVLLTITANPAGGLLGDLLCAIANLLDAGGLLSDVVDLLNQVLDLFGSV